MAQSRKVLLKYIGINQEFKNVYEYSYPDGTLTYEANVQINKKATKKLFATAREAALEVDKILLKNGKDPVNILKRK